MGKKQRANSGLSSDKKQHIQQDEDLHFKMLEQLGLSKEEGLSLMKDIKKKTSNQHKKGSKDQKMREEQQMQQVVDDADLFAGDDGDDQQLTLGDIFQSIGANKMQEQTSSGKKGKVSETINATKLEKQIKELRKEAERNPALSQPLTGRKRLQIERDENYKQVQKHMTKWLPQVKQNRETEQMDFTTRDVQNITEILHSQKGGGVKLNSMNQIASNLKASQATSQLEQQIQQELTRQGLHSENDIKKKEQDQLINQLSNVSFIDKFNRLDADQLEQRYQQISQMKSLLFRQEMKNRRISKIKSKLYHKIKKREKDREEKKLCYIDPEAAQAYREKEEQKKVEERLKQRHSSNNKFAKKLKRFGMMENESIRETYNEMMREKNHLKLRTKKVATGVNGKDNSDSEYSSDEDDSMEEDFDEEALKRKALAAIEDEIEDDSDEDDSDNAGSDSDEDLAMNFASNKKSEKKPSKKEDKGIMGLKFMKRGEERQKEMTKQQAKMLMDQIREDQEILDQSDNDNQAEKQNFFKGAANKFAAKTLQVKELEVVPLTDEQIKKATQKLVVRQAESEEDDSSEEEQSQHKVKKEESKIGKKQGNKKNSKKAEKLEVTFDINEDLKNFKPESKKVISIAKDDQVLRNLFITPQDEEQAMEDFEREKDQEIEDELGNKVKAPVVQRGWNEWAGDGVSEKSHDKKVAILLLMFQHYKFLPGCKNSRRRKLKSQRNKELTAKLKVLSQTLRSVIRNLLRSIWLRNSHILITTLNNSLFFLSNQTVNTIINPNFICYCVIIYKFEALMSVPLGKDWNTIQSHKRLIQPDVLTKAGTIIKPLKYKKDIPMKAETLEALVEHRQGKKEKRPAAKF